MSQVVGVAGAIGAGKDTLAAHLVEAHGFMRVGWADALKDEVAARLHKTLAAYVTVAYPAHSAMVREWIHHLLWVERDAFSRALLQEYGTEVRRCDDPDYWVEAWQTRVWRMERGAEDRSEAFRVVVPDVRFPNEARAIREIGGWLVEVQRPGHVRRGHESETALINYDWDMTFDNSGTIEDLHHAADAWWSRVGLGGAEP